MLNRSEIIFASHMGAIILGLAILSNIIYLGNKDIITIQIIIKGIF